MRGASLPFALQHCGADFKALCLAAETVICCRVTPSQKADVCAARVQPAIIVLDTVCIDSSCHSWLSLFGMPASSRWQWATAATMYVFVRLSTDSGAAQVPMIHQAHVGVGIRGKEGVQVHGWRHDFNVARLQEQPTFRFRSSVCPAMIAWRTVVDRLT